MNEAWFDIALVSWGLSLLMMAVTFGGTDFIKGLERKTKIICWIVLFISTNVLVAKVGDIELVPLHSLWIWTMKPCFALRDKTKHEKEKNKDQ